MGHRVGMALAVLVALLGWISYAQVALLLAVDLAVTYWFTRRRILEAEGVVREGGIRYSASVRSADGRRTTREVAPVLGEPVPPEDRKFITFTTDWFVGFCVLALAVAAFAVDVEGLRMTWWQGVLWLVLSAQLAVSEHLTHRAWRESDAHLTADPTHQGTRDLLAAVGLTFCAFAVGGVFGGGRFPAAVLNLAGAALDHWRRKDVTQSTGGPS